jgi:hypothetical protein
MKKYSAPDLKITKPSNSKILLDVVIQQSDVEIDMGLLEDDE